MHKVFIHEGKGHYIGSVVIIASVTREKAESLIRDWLDNNGLQNEALNVKETHHAVSGEAMLIFANNGDY